MTDWTGIAAVIAPITTLAGVLGGYWLAGRNEEARDRRAVQREDKARHEALADRLEEDRHAAQRETLLQLQDELQALLLITVRSNLQSQRTMLDTGQFSAEPGRDEEGARVSASLHRLQARVLDDGLRAAVNEFAGLCARSAAAIDLALKHPHGSVADVGSRQDAVALMQRQVVDLSNAYTVLTGKLGSELRRELDRRYLATQRPQADGLEGPR